MIFPVKSLLPVEVTYAEVTSEGFRFDRQYVLVKVPPDPSTRLAEHVTVKKTYGLALFQPSIDDQWSKLTIRHTQSRSGGGGRGNGGSEEDSSSPSSSPSPPSSITIPLTPSPFHCTSAATYIVSIFGTTATGVDMGDEVASFFSGHLDLPVRLLFIGGDGRRRIPGAAYTASSTKPLPSLVHQFRGDAQFQAIRFADAAPYLVTSSASEKEALSRLPLDQQGFDILARLRPNIHIDVGDEVPPFDEDEWHELTVYTDGSRTRQKALIRCIFKCARCLSLNADLNNGETAKRENQLYGLLARDRRVNHIFPRECSPNPFYFLLL